MKRGIATLACALLLAGCTALTAPRGGETDAAPSATTPEAIPERPPAIEPTVTAAEAEEGTPAPEAAQDEVEPVRAEPIPEPLPPVEPAAESVAESIPEPAPAPAPETVPASVADAAAATDHDVDTDVDTNAVPDLCAELGNLLGSVSVDGCLASGLVDGGGRSHEGRTLAWTDFSGTDPDAPRVLVVGGIHGDEYSSVSMVFRWIERLGAEHGGDRSWRLIPAANPDGLLRARPATRTNARGVDLNRNFATRGWDEEAQRYWAERTGSDPRRRPGPAAASEAETRWLQTLIAAYAPRVIVSLHAPHALLDFDAAAEAPPAPQRLGFLQLQPLGTYPGSLGRYGSAELGVSVLTLELPWAGIMPSAVDQDALWNDLSAWLAEHLPPAGTATAVTAQ